MFKVGHSNFYEIQGVVCYRQTQAADRLLKKKLIYLCFQNYAVVSPPPKKKSTIELHARKTPHIVKHNAKGYRLSKKLV